MKYFRSACIVMSIIMCFLLASPKASAISEDLDLEPCDKEETAAFLSAIDIVVLTEEPRAAGILSFDVAADGNVVLGFVGETVCVYSPKQEFLYGYAFDTSGDFEVLWNGENVAIYFYRSSMIATFNSSGDCIALAKVVSSAKNNVYVRKVLSGTSKILAGVTYELERDVPLGSTYGRLCIIHADGTRNVFYDASETQSISVVLSLVFALLFAGSVIALCIRRVRQRIRQVTVRNH